MEDAQMFTHMCHKGSLTRATSLLPITCVGTLLHVLALNIVITLTHIFALVPTILLSCKAETCIRESMLPPTLLVNGDAASILHAGTFGKGSSWQV